MPVGELAHRGSGPDGASYGFQRGVGKGCCIGSVADIWPGITKLLQTRLQSGRRSYALLFKIQK